MTQDRTIIRICNTIEYVLPYRKFLSDYGTHYNYFFPIEVIEFTSSKTGRDLNALILQNEKHPVKSIDFLKAKDPKNIPLDTDPLVVKIMGGGFKQFATLNDEDIRQAICQKFNIEVLKPEEKFNSDDLLGVPTSDEVKKELSLTGDQVTRYCQFIECGTEMKVYKSDIVNGKGLFCCKSHASKCKSLERIHNMCLNCGISFDSLYPEECCCDECYKVYSTKQ